uniref:Uncharacterized protein n=1 Tax=Anguilla anguilla TaxID=7936 RepID=A0A0E9S5D3_ANGAN
MRKRQRSVQTPFDAVYRSHKTEKKEF